jgi:hypothetical protein
VNLLLDDWGRKRRQHLLYNGFVRAALCLFNCLRFIGLLGQKVTYSGDVRNGGLRKAADAGFHLALRRLLRVLGMLFDVMLLLFMVFVRRFRIRSV